MFTPNRWTAALYAGLGAGAITIVAEIVLWWAFTDALPGILYRDAHMAAALLVGGEALAMPDAFDWRVIVVAMAMHFALSVFYAWVLSWLIPNRMVWATLLVGGAFGLALFVVNLFALTEYFPWFVVARDWITAFAHLVLGASMAVLLNLQRAPDSRSAAL